MAYSQYFEREYRAVFRKYEFQEGVRKDLKDFLRPEKRQQFLAYVKRLIETSTSELDAVETTAKKIWLSSLDFITRLDSDYLLSQLSEQEQAELKRIHPELPRGFLIRAVRNKALHDCVMAMTMTMTEAKEKIAPQDLLSGPFAATAGLFVTVATPVIPDTGSDKQYIDNRGSRINSDLDIIDGIGQTRRNYYDDSWEIDFLDKQPWYTANTPEGDCEFLALGNKCNFDFRTRPVYLLLQLETSLPDSVLIDLVYNIDGARFTQADIARTLPENAVAFAEEVLKALKDHTPKEMSRLLKILQEKESTLTARGKVAKSILLEKCLGSSAEQKAVKKDAPEDQEALYEREKQKHIDALLATRTPEQMRPLLEGLLEKERTLAARGKQDALESLPKQETDESLGVRFAPR